ncbi:protein-serine/threonine phosphatase [Ranunculus cassubicifolius]
MALLTQQLQRHILYTTKNPNSSIISKPKKKLHCCSAIAIDSQPPSLGLTDVAGIKWGSVKLQGFREEMEDEVILKPNDIGGFSFAAVFDGHAGFSSVEFLREELYKECVAALQGGMLLTEKSLSLVKKALEDAFVNADIKLLKWLEETGEEVESGSTATVMFARKDNLIISHVGDSSVVISRSGKAEVLTNPHRPYGNNKVSLQEIRRIKEAGGWIVNGRICGDISVSRAFGDIRFKTKKNEMLVQGVQEGRFSAKFVSRVQLKDDLVIASPDVYQVSLASDAEFILLASDGLWDYINSLDAVTFVRNQLCQHGNVQDRCSQDNVSIIIADLGRTDWKTLPPPQQNFVWELSQAFATIGIVSVGIWVTSMLSL